MRVDALRLVQQAVRHHLVHAAVDAVVEFGAVAGEAHLDDTEGAFFLGLRAEGGVGASRHVADFQGVDDALGVFQIDDAVVFGVHQAELGAEVLQAFRFVFM